MNVAFYYTNKRTAGKDVRNVLEGNPGIGGAYYAMLLLAKLLTGKEDTIKVYLFAEYTDLLPEGLNIIYVPSIETLSKAIADNDINVLVVNKIGRDTVERKFFSAVNGVNVKVVIWGHCFIPYKELNYYSSNPQVAMLVAVGREQLLTMCDHPIFQKSTYIYNICKYPQQELIDFKKRENNVVYIGSIVPLKGLHLLTDAWPTILKAVPDANLYIIGGGNLYNSKAKLGKYGIAERFYEKRLLKNIIDKNGDIEKSVHFCGVMGNEKFEILNRAKVGVPNPGGLTETFGFTAVEMLLSGTLVTTIKCPGYLDTVHDEESILYDSASKLADSVIALLKRKNHESTNAINYINEEFNSDVITEKWIALFKDLCVGKKTCKVNLDSQLRLTKWKVVNRKLKQYAPFLPSLILYVEVFEKIVYVIRKCVNFNDTIQKIYYRKIMNRN